MDINSFVIGFAKGKKSGTGFFSTKENNAGGLTYAFKATEGGGGSGGGAELNIAYGDTAPEDTTKLWVKSSEATAVEIREETLMPIIDTTMPVGKFGMGQAIVGNKLYLIGGNDGNTDTSNNGSTCAATNTIFCFDMDDRTCTKLSITLPFYAYGVGCASIGTNIYIFGGFGSTSKWSSANGLKAIYCFDTVAMTISQLSATLSTGCCGMGVGVIGSKIYLFGGCSHWGSNNTVNSAYCFDVDTQTITILSVLSDRRNHIGVVAHNDMLYLLGGFNSYGRTTVQIYDPETDTYTTADSLPVSYGNGNGFAKIGSKLYLPTGFYPSGTVAKNFTNTLIIFDLDTLTAYVADYIFPYKLQYASCGYLNGDIYVLGGKIEVTSDPHSSTYTNSIVKVPTELPLTNKTLWVKVASGYPNIVVNCTESIKVGVNVTGVYMGNVDNEGEPVEAALYKDGAWTTI